MMISESYIWTFRDSFYQFVLDPKNYVPGFSIGVIFAVLMIFFNGLSANPLMGFIGHVVLVMVLFLICNIAWEYWRYRQMSEAQKTIQWDIGEKTINRVDDEGRITSLRWSSITRVKRTMSGYMLHRKQGSPLWISINLFTPSQAEHFEAFLDETVGGA